MPGNFQFTRLARITASCVFDGPSNGESCLAYVRQALVQTPNPASSSSRTTSAAIRDGPRRHPCGRARLLRKHAPNLTRNQRGRLTACPAGQPAIASIHDFTKVMMALLMAMNQTKAGCRILVHRPLDCVRQFLESPIENCEKLDRTLAAWQVEIGRMWRFSRSNEIMLEACLRHDAGVHRKMKLIQRRAFGIRNFENCRRRVRALCA